MGRLTLEQRQLFNRLHDKKVNDKSVLMDEEYIGLFAEAIDKYSDSAHFIYELLQNADDAKATEVNIILKPDKLIFKHNGTRHFNITEKGVKPQGDINAITGIGFSNKKNDLSTENKIGKFGLGFKSVLQYTDTPEIYDDVFKFKIENMIVPTLLEYDYPDRLDGETLFVLPFKQDKTKQCFREIKERLETLDNPLLFLNNLKKVIWRIDVTERNKGREKFFDKILLEQIQYKQNIELSRYDLRGGNADSHIFLFSQQIDIEGESHKIFVGFYYDLGNKCLITNQEQKIHCFFPTNETFETCFVTHAPFLLTNSRQNLKPSESTNVSLLSSLAALAAKSVVLLRDYGVHNKQLLINENIVDIIPKYNASYYYYNQSYNFEHIMATAFEDILEDEPLMLSRNNNYMMLDDSYITTNAIYELISQEQFVYLHGAIDDDDDYYDDDDDDDIEIEEQEAEYNENIDFLKWELRMKISELRNSVTIYNSIHDFSVEDLANDISVSFMEKQKIEWVTRFYTFLRNDAPKYWKITPQSKNTAHFFRHAPIIRTQKDNWVKPYIDLTTPNVFIPLNKEQSVNSCDDYNFIHEEYLNDDMACKFFSELEISTPDEYNYITAVILNRYRHNTVNNEGLIDDFIVLVQYYVKIKDNEQKLKEYLNILHRDLFVYCTDKYYRKPSKVYYNSNVLKKYFSPYEKHCRKYYGTSYNIFYLDEDYYKKIRIHFNTSVYDEFFDLLGVARYPRMERLSNSYDWSNRAKIQQNYQEKSLYQDFNLKGLLNLLQNSGGENIDKELSLYLWNEVLPQANCEKYKEMTVKYRVKYARDYTYVRFDSELIFILTNSCWIFDKEGNLHTSQDIIQEDLSKEYNLYNGNIQLLGIEKKQRDLTKLGATDEEQENFDLGSRIKQEMGNDLSEEEVLQAIRQCKAHKQRKKDSEVESDNKKNDSASTTTESEAEETIADKLNKKWEAQKQRSVNKPHSQTNSGDLFDYANYNEVSSPENDSPFFTNQIGGNNSPSNDEDETNKAEKNLKAKNTKAQESAEDAKDQVEILDLLKQTPKYSFKWYKILMELMHAGQSKITNRRTQIDFSKYEIICSGKILHLTEPSLPVPAWISDAEKYSITLLSDNKTDKLDGLIIKSEDNALDISIELDDKMASNISMAKRIRVIAIDNTNIVDSLETRFLQLDKDDYFDMNANLPTNLSFIYGPPGTGKTTELVKQVHEILEQEPNAKILVLTPTNKAADVVAIKMTNDDVCEAALARYGATESLYLIEEIGCVTHRDTTDMEWHNIVVATAARYAYDYVQPDDTAICDYPWDYIFIDEASMIDILTVTYILYKGASAKKIIISGDPMQIQPVAQNDMPELNIYDMVNLHGFSNAIFDYERYPVKCLTMQHRSTPIIGKLVSDFAYDGLVDYDPNRAPKKPLVIDGITVKDINFCGFEIALLDDIKGLNSIGQSAFNLYSVIFTYNMIEYIIKQITKNHPNLEYTIGVVCAYRAQSDAIKNMLENRSLDTEYCKVSCGTVHSFQGDECDIMFIVLNPPANCTSGAHVNNQNIINVAMSRARDYIFFVTPRGQIKGFTMKNRIGKLLDYHDMMIHECRNIEKIMFNGNDNFIYENTHVTCHMPVNVYCEDSALYEVRMSDDALDIKINNQK